MARTDFAIAVAWRLGLFIAATVAFPFALAVILKASNCRGVGGACGALALVIGVYVKPIIVIAFVASLFGVAIRRMRDLGVPGLVGLFVPLLLLFDWQFLTIVGAPWSVGFVLGGPGGPPYFFLSALACMTVLCCLASGEAPAARFGIAGKLAIAVTIAVVVLGLVRFFFFGLVMSGGMTTAMAMLKVVGLAFRVAPWLLLFQVCVFAYLVWQDRSRRDDTTPPRRVTRTAFGQRTG